MLDLIRKNVIYLDGNMIHSSETRKPLRVNFERSGLKKIIEEEDARHVEAMHYAAERRSSPELGFGDGLRVREERQDRLGGSKTC